MSPTRADSEARFMRILVFNWRDIKNPEAGGAEVYTHEIMKRLAAKGYEITWITAGFEGGKENEIVDGIEIVRVGGKYSVYRKARRFYENSKTKYDVVIDEINTRPFMTPRFVGEDERVFALIHQLAREFWFYETPFPLSYIGRYFLEDSWLSHYKNIPTLTVSQSTARDLADLGFKNVIIVPDGIDIEPLPSVPEKEKTPTIVFVGRFKKAKLPDHAIEAYKMVKKTIPDVRLWMIGDGYLRKNLERIADENIKFFGYVSKEKRIDLVARSHILVVPAVREGWGLVVTEANAVGTPAIGYNVPGLRDSIKNQVTGILSKPNPSDLAMEVVRLIHDTQKLFKLSDSALEDARRYSWDHSARMVEEILEAYS